MAAAITLSLALMLLVAEGTVPAATHGADGPDSCEALGFSHPSCGDCDRLQEVLSSDSKDAAALLDECRQCCDESCAKDEGAAMFVHAELQGDSRHLHALPELKAFLDSNKKKLKRERLTVTYISSIKPRLRLTKADGTVETLRVDNWKKQALDEFLAERVQQGGAGFGTNSA